MSDAQSKSKIDSSVEYKMNHKKRGLALIFNHEKFSDLPQRCGTNKDRDNLRERFEALGFDVQSHNNKCKEEVLCELRKAASANHSNADCFVCIFLTHGKKRQIYAYDETIAIKGITDLFRGDQCKSLVGKPKIFIFQSCAGNKYEQAVTGMAAGDSDDDDNEEMEEAADIFTIPAGADFLMCYSVAEGFYSFRHREHGAFYIQDLCETLQQHASTMEFTELLTLVNLKVSRRTADVSSTVRNKKQIPCFTSLLTKKLYFRTKKE